MERRLLAIRAMTNYLHLAIDTTRLENTDGFRQFMSRYAGIEYRPGVYLIRTEIKPHELKGALQPYIVNSDVCIFQVDPQYLQKGILPSDVTAFVGQQRAA